VRIPKGITPGQHIRLAGQGDPGPGGGPAGDLYLEVQFRPHRHYRAEGRDVYVDVPVAPWELALGAKIRVPTPEGKVEVTVPASSRPTHKLRLAGRGIPGKARGDLYVTLRLVLPPADSDKVKRMYEKMRQETDFDPRANLGL
jgi:curved DNA-binding protein